MRKFAQILFLLPVLAFGQNSMELKTIQILNDYRISKSLPELVLNKGLCKAAQHQVEYKTLKNDTINPKTREF